MYLSATLFMAIRGCLVIARVKDIDFLIVRVILQAISGLGSVLSTVKLLADI